jgi:uncharacterized membrane-anchored protein
VILECPAQPANGAPQLMYWMATIISNALGTSTGDYLAHDKKGLGVGYLVSTVIISAALLMLLVAH